MAKAANMPPDRDVPDDKSIRTVNNLKDFVGESFGPDANAIRLKRTLSADFNAAAVDLNRIFSDRRENFKGMKYLSEADLQSARLQANKETQKALDIIIDDIRSLKKTWDTVCLRLITSSEGRIEKFHTDGTDAHLGRVLCSYNEPTTLGLLPQDAVKNGRDDTYNPAPGAKPFDLRAGDLWRCAGTFAAKTANVPPFVHRAPSDKSLRLLLVGDGPLR